MTDKAHPLDILLAATYDEARLYPQFSRDQVVPLAMFSRLHGLHPRMVWYTGCWAKQSPMRAMNEANALAAKNGGYLLHVDEWKPEPPTVVDLIAALPASNVVGIAVPDYGRGYSKAIKDVLKLLAEVSDK